MKKLKKEKKTMNSYSNFDDGKKRRRMKPLHKEKYRLNTFIDE